MQLGDWVHRRYRLDRVLGQGSLGTTYAAHDRFQQRGVALKLLRHEQTALSEYLQREFLTLRGLSHPHLAQVFDFGYYQDLAYFTSRYVAGSTLVEYARGKTWDVIRSAVIDVLDALDFLHMLQILHGDIKPENILVDAQGRTVLIDLSCARPITSASGAAMGTAPYIAPEVWNGDASVRSDLYALGITLQRTFEHLSEPPPAHVLTLCDTLTRLSPADRPLSARVVMEQLGAEPHPYALRNLTHGTLHGREEQLQIFERTLSDLLARNAGVRVLWFFGPEGSGRSRLLRELKWRAQTKAPVIEARSHDPEAILRWLAWAAPERNPPRDLVTLADTYSALLAQAHPQVMLLDDVDALDDDQRVLLDAMLRLTESNSAILLCVASGAPYEVRNTGVCNVALNPLSPSALREWFGPELTDHQLSNLHRLSGGWPLRLEQLALHVDQGESALERIAQQTGTLSQQRYRQLLTLSAQAQVALVRLCLINEADTSAIKDADPYTWLDLELAGFIESSAGRYQLSSFLNARAILQALGAELVNPLAHALAQHYLERLQQSAAAHVSPQLLAHTLQLLCIAQQVRQARQCAQAHAGIMLKAPQLFRNVAETLCIPQMPLSELELYFEIWLEVGEARRALRAAAAWIRVHAALRHETSIVMWVGRLYLSAGGVRRALKYLRRAQATCDDATLRPKITEALSLALIKHGDYAQAREVCEQLQASAPSTATELHVALNYVLALIYLGEQTRAEQVLRDTELLAEKRNEPGLRFRVHSVRGFSALRFAKLDQAPAAYQKALEIAETVGMPSEVTRTTLNLGVTLHQLGEWSGALGYYGRALRIATALGLESTALTLRFNLSRLYLDLGAVRESERIIDRVSSDASRTSMSLIEGAAVCLLGEVRAVQRQFGEARQYFEQALEHFRRERAPREELETMLHLAELDLQEERTATVMDTAALATAAEASGFEDVFCRALTVHSKFLLKEGQQQQALECAEQALVLAKKLQQRLLEATAHTHLAQVMDVAKAPTAAQTHRQAARSLWERMAMSLPDDLQTTFWSHKLRETAQPSVREAPPSSHYDRRLWKQWVHTNRRINSSLSVEQVLEAAMDAAVELTAAERGFLLLRAVEGEQFSVAVARNLDKEKIGKAQLKFSHGIAQRVIEEGESVVTVDASADDRFAEHQSVHALKLKSVVCVPIRSPRGILGALYLDNRFQRGRFAEDDAELLSALADQVAIALHNAELVEALRKRTTELEAEREKVTQLLTEQRDQIERLSSEVQQQRMSLAFRYDYSQIRGSSVAMQKVFAILDKVIGKPINVLIEGESGTGKELIARAIHFNGPRKHGPFVAINCGALPDTLLEAELFGYKRGAFTGAVQDHRGLFVQAHQGTLFLDELGEMTPAMQVKLLRVIQERIVQPLGAQKAQNIDVQLISATNRSLMNEIEQGRFRQDLYYRVAVVKISLPPLRKRLEDIPELASAILERVAGGAQPLPTMTRAALRKLMTYDWPGNVRQLENVLTRSYLMSEEALIEADGIEIVEVPSERTGSDNTGIPSKQDDLARVMYEALTQTQWNVVAAAQKLGMARATFYRKLRQFGLTRPT